MTADMFAEQDKRFSTAFGQQVVIKGEQGPKGDKGDKGEPGERGPAGPAGADAPVTTESIKDALGYKPADDAAMAGKLTEPTTGLAVGKYFRIAAIDENGHAVLEAVDANVGGLSTEPSLWPAWTSDEQAELPAQELTTEDRLAALEAANNDMILLLADLIGG